MSDINRRKMLGFGAAAVAGGFGVMAGSSLPVLGAPAASASEATEFGTMAYCANPSTLALHTAVGGAAFMNEGGGAGNLRIHEPFFKELYNWRVFWHANTPYPSSTELWNLGAYSARDGQCRSWHEAGRAIDICSLQDATTKMQFWARYDRWKDLSNAAAHRRKYWAGAASLHYHFRSVLTYFWDEKHANHIHADNGESDGALSSFTTGSEAQVQAVQGICGNIWGYPCGVDGVWDSTVAASSDRVLTRIGKGGHLTSGQSYWQAFLRASVRHATGKQTY